MLNTNNHITKLGKVKKTSDMMIPRKPMKGKKPVKGKIPEEYLT